MRLFRARQPSAPKRRILRLSKPPAAIYAIGDIHGCIDLLRAAEARIMADRAGADDTALIIALGDVIDRGPDSAAVLDHLSGPAPEGCSRVTICGNHEDMFLQFLADPVSNAAWMDAGGAETLRSYGVDPGAPPRSRQRLRAIAADLAVVLPPEHRRFLQELPLCLLVGDMCFAHATYDFDKPPEAQSARTVLWGEEGPLRGADGGLLVHGHYAVDKPEVEPGRINVDTGAYSTGRLTTVKISGPERLVKIL